MDWYVTATAFVLSVALSLVIVIAAVWGFVTGEYVSGQTYIALAMTLMLSYFWWKCLKD